MTSEARQWPEPVIKVLGIKPVFETGSSGGDPAPYLAGKAAIQDVFKLFNKQLMYIYQKLL